MPGLSDTIARLNAMRAMRSAAPNTGRTRLTPLAGFGQNPGALVAKTYVPDDLKAAAALVVVLHGCTQDAETYDRGSGWSQIADEQGLALLYPEQVRGNNANLCFNWFEPGDTRRGSGEAASIHQMVEAMIAAHNLDRSHVFVTGLSAGGAMTSVMLATYPDVFASGAIIAGLPYGAAASMPEAFVQMRGASASVASVRAASGHGGPWPTVSIWHGDADLVVDASNAAAIVAQWRAVHGVGDAAARNERGDGYARRVWTDGGGREVIDCNIVYGLGHGTPLATRGAEGCGVAGAHMLEAGVLSTRAITRFWGLETRPVRASVPGPAANDVPCSFVPSDTGYAGAGPGRVIEDALRAAGLMR
ncbi:MAG: PHB depolymerase family esterase [Sphingomonadaceae bacterium]|nr:PHB depolymerase family esterase [Sphingomonadaceae bacterium]